MLRIIKRYIFILTLFVSLFILMGRIVFADDIPQHSPGALPVPYDARVFTPDPDYSDQVYNSAAQLVIYGGKQSFDTPRPLLELGRSIYTSGPFNESSYIFGRKNPVDSQLVVYGDWRTGLSFIDTGVNNVVVLATRFNLDIDWKLTATERLHALLRPLEENGQLTRIEFNKNVQGAREENSELEFSESLDALFFEGDLGAIVSGMSDEYTSWDLPFAIGLMPLLFQNGVWLDDAFTGLAFTLPAMNSALLDISNMDVTFFAGFDNVSSVIVGSNNERDINLYGLTAFIEANRGYWELGYGYTDDRSFIGDQSYHNLTVAFSRRYGGWLSNSIRWIGNFGQERDDGALSTADGFLLLVENSFITSKPSTLIPYFNLFVGIDRPQSLARDVGAGGVLKNTGITFEAAGLTGIPAMDATANDSAGFALGIEYLFNFRQQLVLEVGALFTHGDDNNRNVAGNQQGLGVRYQKPFTNAWLFRVDLNVIRTVISTSSEDDIRAGINIELRRKF